MRARAGWTAGVILSLASVRVAHATPPIYAPFPCDDTYSVTQGHNTGSHTGKGAWAWDIGIPVGGEVAAPADGVVRAIKMDSTTGGCSSAYANDANYVVIDFGDGTEALLLHLQANSSPFQVGDLVKQGDVVGKVGLTGWVCGAHLHFQIQQTCASWWCQSVPSSFVTYGDPGDGVSMVSNNCPALVPCAPLAGGETLVDEKQACFERETSYWWSVAEGWDGHHYFTYGTAAAANDTVGRWNMQVDVPGTYRVDAFIPDGATSVGTHYVVEPGSGAYELAAVNQATQKGWVTLGQANFEAGQGRYVALGDATGESPDLDRKVAYDALRFTFVPPPPPEGGAGGAGGAGGSGAEGGLGGLAGGAGGALGGSGPGGAGGSGASGIGGQGQVPEATSGSCACGVARGLPGEAPAGLMAIVAGVLAWSRRVRKARALPSTRPRPHP